MARYRLNDRLAEFEACSKTLEWSFRENDEWGLIKMLLDFKLFNKGHRRKICPLIVFDKGDLEYTCVFDYAYTISSKNSSHTYRQTVYFRYSKALALPHFVMVPEKWYHRVGIYFGMQDINFEEYPTFSRNYLLKGTDEDYIRHHFNHPDLVRFFDNQAFYSMEGMNYLLVLYKNNVLLSKAQIVKLVRVGNSIHNYLADKTPDIALPEFILDDPIAPES